METQLYFWKPLMQRHKKELAMVEDYFNKTKTFFHDIDKQATEYGDKLFREYPADEDTDFSAVAEAANEESAEMYENLLRMQSNHLLMTISLLYHTWEQQLIKFTLSEMSNYFDFTKRVLDFKGVQTIFKLHKVDITKTEAWSEIRELKFLANTIKHGDGESADKLRKIRPDFFTSEYFDDPVDLLKLNGAVLLDGYTIKAHESDLYNYIIAVQKFWDEMPERAFSDTKKIIEKMNK
ncbi:hypothetical protein J45TS6_29120 [Paenibacillus sp. J45TS6]|uniref:hypothetical protein n=1 Tax=Paenibacillus sp. J45TS6 TaxID=2807196 RepID=UPI001B2BBCCF|nr:hypothetical protein [Paenibacillus sp. J45TS6]GIP44453.1 hypothetical protein J45TS6_29120 [Paenibacillus sp. J45TS6]